MSQKQMSEALVTIGGIPLEFRHSMTLRNALAQFREAMSEPDALGEDEIGRGIATGYKQSCEEMLKLIHKTIDDGVVVIYNTTTSPRLISDIINTPVFGNVAKSEFHDVNTNAVADRVLSCLQLGTRLGLTEDELQKTLENAYEAHLSNLDLEKQEK